MASAEEKVDSTVISYGDKIVAVPLTDKELTCYINDVEKLKANPGHQGKYSTWIKGLCRIFFATTTHTGSIPKMDRKWMLDVMEAPATAKKDNITTVPLTVQMKATTPKQPAVKSSIVPPNNAKMTEAPIVDMSTAQYIQNILRENQIWQQRNVSQVHLPKAKVTVQAVKPIPIEKPNVNDGDDDDANDFSYEDNLLQLQNETTDEPSTESDEMIARLQQRIYDEETMESRLQDLRQMREEGEESTNEDLLVVETDSSEDELMNLDFESDENEGLHFSEEEIEEEDTEDAQSSVKDDNESSQREDNVSSQREDNESSQKEENEEVLSMPPVVRLPTRATTPLSLDFLDSLGRLWEEKSEMSKSMADIKLFDGAGRPVEMPPVNAEKEDEASSELTASNAVYVDVDTKQLEAVEEYSMKRKTPTTDDGKPAKVKKLKIVVKKKEEEDSISKLRRMLNLPLKEKVAEKEPENVAEKEAEKLPENEAESPSGNDDEDFTDVTPPDRKRRPALPVSKEVKAVLKQILEENANTESDDSNKENWEAKIPMPVKEFIQQRKVAAASASAGQCDLMCDENAGNLQASDPSPKADDDIQDTSLNMDNMRKQKLDHLRRQYEMRKSTGRFTIPVNMPIDDIFCTAMISMHSHGKFEKCIDRIRNGPYHRAMDDVGVEAKLIILKKNHLVVEYINHVLDVTSLHITAFLKLRNLVVEYIVGTIPDHIIEYNWPKKEIRRKKLPTGKLSSCMNDMFDILGGMSEIATESSEEPRKINEKRNTCAERKKVKSDLLLIRPASNDDVAKYWTRKQKMRWLYCYESEPPRTNATDELSRWKAFSKRLKDDFGVEKDNVKCQKQRVWMKERFDKLTQRTGQLVVNYQS